MPSVSGAYPWSCISSVSHLAPGEVNCQSMEVPGSFVRRNSLGVPLIQGTFCRFQTRQMQVKKSIDFQHKELNFPHLAPRSFLHAEALEMSVIEMHHAQHRRCHHLAKPNHLLEAWSLWEDIINKHTLESEWDQEEEGDYGIFLNDRAPRVYPKGPKRRTFKNSSSAISS